MTPVAINALITCEYVINIIVAIITIVARKYIRTTIINVNPKYDFYS